MRLPDPTSSRIHGFSQADFILILGCVLALGSLVSPALNRFRETGRQTRCLSNLKTLNDAVLQHARDHGGRLLTTKSTPPPGGWWSYDKAIQSQVPATVPGGARNPVFACPSDRGFTHSGEKLVPFHKSPKHNFTSYVFNGVTLPGIPNVSGRTLESIRDPARTLLMMEWAAHGPLSWHQSRTGRENSPFYDGAECVVGFVDGSVRLVPIHFDGLNAAYTRDPAPGFSYKYSGD